MPDRPSRLGIFIFFDPNGVVDRYVLYLLGALRPELTRMVAVSNCPLDKKADAALRQYADDVFVRENRGLDAAAFKAALTRFCGWDEVTRYDEVVLFNDTFYGPIGSASEMFAEMWARDLDFWGMSAGYPAVDGWKRIRYGYIPAHIQTFFIVFRHRMVSNLAFQRYWEGLSDELNDFDSVVTGHETVMTQHFEDLGFRWDIYADTERYRSPVRSENFTLYHHHCLSMLQDMHFPALKKKVLNVNLPDFLYMNDLEEPAQAIAYIRDKTDYDVDMIWDNALRLYNVTALYRSLHLNYVLPSVHRDTPAAHAALVFHIANPFFLQRMLQRALLLVQSLDIFLIPEDSQVALSLREALPSGSRVNLLAPQETEMGAFVRSCGELARRYEFLGFVHDIRNPSHAPLCAPESTVYGFLENIARDTDYITQVLGAFADEPRLGVLGTPFPIHHDNFAYYGNGWCGTFDAVQALAEQLDLHCRLAEDVPPLLVTGAFWCRTAALRALWSQAWDAKRFRRSAISDACETNEALKRLLPYAAQSEGYYSGIVMHTEYASMRLTSQQDMLDTIVASARQNLGCASTNYAGFLRQFESVSLDGTYGSALIVPERLSLRTLTRIYLERCTPKWFGRTLLRMYRAVKKLFLR